MHKTRKPLGPALTLRLCLSLHPAPVLLPVPHSNDHSRRQVWLQQVLSLEERSSAVGGARSGGSQSSSEVMDTVPQPRGDGHSQASCKGTGAQQDPCAQPSRPPQGMELHQASGAPKKPQGPALTHSRMAPHPPHSPPARGAGDYKQQQQLAQAVKLLNKDSRYPIIK